MLFQELVAFVEITVIGWWLNYMSITTLRQVNETTTIALLFKAIRTSWDSLTFASLILWNGTTGLAEMASFESAAPPTLTHRSVTSPVKRLAFANNLSIYDTFSANVYDRRSEPATWSRLTPALAQKIKEELNSYKMEEMEVHSSSRIQYVPFSSMIHK